MSDDLTRLGLGLAAVARPGYITLGRAEDLPAGRSVEALRARAHQLLDDAWAAGVRHVDVARSYGLAEQFLAEWVALRSPIGLVVSSKWGYTYTAGWTVDAEVHEAKTHDVATFDRQLAETRALLDGHLDLYQVHSLTPESPLLHDTALQARLAEVRAGGLPLGFSTSGPAQAETVERGLALRVDGVALFGAVQSTWNLLETSVGPALAAAHEAGVRVIVKEGVANGRLTSRGGDEAAAAVRVAQRRGCTLDALALGAALAQPFVDLVLSGAVTQDQLRSNLAAAEVVLDADDLAELAAVAQPPAEYWSARGALAWS
ncbi:aldo/keto reductase [Rhodococcus aerolatus]